MANDRRVTFLFGADASNFIKTVNKVENRFASFGREIEGLGKSLTTKITAPLVGLGIAAGKSAVDFEDAFAGVRKTVNATELEFGELRKGILQMSRDLPTSASDIAKIAENAGQLGIESQNILEFTKIMVMLGDTTNIVGEEAATAFARIANVMQLPQDQFDRMGSSVVELGNNFATTESEIVEFAKRMSGAGKIAGLTTANIFGISTALSSVGVEAEAGGTAVQKTLLAINEAVVAGGSELGMFANTARLSVDEFRKLWKENAAEAFTLFVEGLGKDGDQASLTLKSLGLDNERLKRSFLSLAESGDLLRRTITTSNEAWKENSALTEEAQKRYDTARSFINRAKQSIFELGAAFDQQLLPPIKRASEGIINFAQNVSELSNESKQEIIGLIKTIALIPVGIYAVGKAITLTALAVKGAVALFAGLKATVIALTASTAPLWGVFLGVVSIFSSVVVAGQYLVDNWEKIKLGMLNILNTIGIAFKKMALTGIKAVNELVEFILGDANLIGLLSKLFGIDLGEMVTDGLGFTDAIKSLEAEIEVGEKILSLGIQSYSELEWGSIGDAAKSALDKTKQTLINGFKGLLSSTEIDSLWNDFMGLFEGSANIDTSKIDSATNGINEFRQEVERASWTVADFPALDLTDKMVNVPEATSTLEDFKNKAVELGPALQSQVSSAIISFSETLGNVFTGDGGAKGFFNSILLIITDFMEQFGKIMIAFGVAKQALSFAVDPITAIIAGAALVATATAAKNLLKSGPAQEMEKGGIVPAGFPNDTYPAMLSSGETVIPKPIPLPSGGYSSGGFSEKSLVKALNQVKWVQRGSDLVAVMNSYNSGIGR